MQFGKKVPRIYQMNGHISVNSYVRGFFFSDSFVIALFYIIFLHFKPLIGGLLLLHLLKCIITFGVAVLFWGMVLLTSEESAFCFSHVYRINKMDCLVTNSSPVHSCRIGTYNLPVLAHVIYLYCICSPAVHSFCSILGAGLCCRKELISAVCSQLALVSRV